MSKDYRTLYPSGIGYLCDILYKDGSLAKQKNAMEASEWFDDTIRILFVEFAVYNPSLNTAISG